MELETGKLSIDIDLKGVATLGSRLVIFGLERGNQSRDKGEGVGGAAGLTGSIVMCC